MDYNKIEPERKYRRQSRLEMERRTTMAKKTIMPLLKQATRQDYFDWIKSSFCSERKQEYRHRNIPWEFASDKWYVATNHLLMPVELYGAESINIIVPAHIYVEYNPNIHMHWGHIKFHFEKTGTTSDGIIEMYSDVLAINDETKAKEKKKSWFRRSI